MLDQNLTSLYFSIMSFRRKWVSDTNLSRLLHETIEKKEANKQSKLPDFCKDAILSATIKRISTALVVNDNQDCSMKSLNLVAASKNTSSLVPKTHDSHITNQKHSSSCSGMEILDLEHGKNENMDVKSQESTQPPFPQDWTISDTTEVNNAQCFSPKRKRQPSSDGSDNSITDISIVSSNVSPLKKRREEKSLKKNADCDAMAGKLSRHWYTESISSSKSLHPGHEHFREQRSQSVPHLTSFIDQDNLLRSSKSNFTSPKSVVSSISELSIHDCWKSESDSPPWCFPNRELVETDPLELNGFFQELKSVTVHPN